MKIGKKIRMLRELRGFSQDFVSIQLEISQATYSKIENECTKIDITRLMCIADILDIDLISLLQFEESNIDGIVAHCSKKLKKGLSEKQTCYEDRITHLEEKVELIKEIIIAKSKN